jgi:class 3 adenylate cyclase/pimeloyl-ACP methyl ester carboxylesterase
MGSLERSIGDRGLASPRDGATAARIPQTQWARTVDGACIAYQDIGSGPTALVVIHGWVSHLEVYWEQPRYARFIRRLSRNLRVLVFDKRGIGMSDRFTSAPTLETRMDDVRAVLDAAGVDRAAVFGWGTGGPPLAVLFAATYPDRAIALLIDGEVRDRRGDEFPWGQTDEEFEESLTHLVATWGDDDHAREFAQAGEYDPGDDEAFRLWGARLARFAATPASYEAFERMWFETDVTDVLPAVRVPSAVLYKTGERGYGEDYARYTSQRIPGCRLIPVPGETGVWWVEEPEPFASAVEEFVSSVRREEAELDRVLATVLFTDIVGSTDKACQMGDASWQELLQKHHNAVRAMLGRYRGTEVKTMGDGFLATFDGPARGVRCAQGICEAVKPLGLEVRAGCHTGEIELSGGDVGGIAVHIGARIAALAGPSEVLVSSTVKDLVAGSGLQFAERGENELKGVPGSWRLYAVKNPQ